MGHYDDCYAREDEKQAIEERKRHARMVKGIEKDIAERGLPEVLADIVGDPGLYKLRWL